MTYEIYDCSGSGWHLVGTITADTKPEAESKGREMNHDQAVVAIKLEDE